jgi:hypothetical protein
MSILDIIAILIIILLGLALKSTVYFFVMLINSIMENKL